MKKFWNFYLRYLIQEFRLEEFPNFRIPARGVLDVLRLSLGVFEEFSNVRAENFKILIAAFGGFLNVDYLFGEFTEFRNFYPAN